MEWSWLDNKGFKSSCNRIEKTWNWIMAQELYKLFIKYRTQCYWIVSQIIFTFWKLFPTVFAISNVDSESVFSIITMRSNCVLLRSCGLCNKSFWEIQIQLSMNACSQLGTRNWLFLPNLSTRSYPLGIKRLVSTHQSPKS